MESTRPFSIRITAGLRDRIRAHAQMEDMSSSQWVQRQIFAALKPEDVDLNFADQGDRLDDHERRLVALARRLDDLEQLAYRSSVS